MYSLQESESPRELLGWLEDPLVLELTVLVAFAAAFVWMLLRIRYSLGKLSGRKLLRAYLEGVEARLAGDPEAARKLLVPVVEADPENTGARLALGDAFYLLDEPSAAHAHHMEAREVFAAGGPMVDLALAKDLHAAGELADAVEVIDRALAAEPRNEEILEQAWSIKEEAGLFGEALRAGRSLFGRRKAASIGRRLALTAARAGMHCLSREDRERARAYFKESLGLDPGNVLAQRGSLLVGKQPAAGLLLGESESQLLPALRSSGGFLALFPEALCAACGSPRQPDGDAACCACGSAKAPVYAETSMGEAIPSPDELYDEIEENDAWFERLARRLSTGD
ncbi:MAG: tetratricopeptide repeat protein, partial [Planctomycetota bacterium]